MKVLGIAGSPRKNGNTQMLLGHVLKAVAEEGLETEMVSLAGLDIRPCNACMSCTKEERCSIKDDLMPVYLKMKEADGLVLASPVYFHTTAGLMKSFMERCGYIALWNNRPFNRKVGGPFVVARRAGHNTALAEMSFWFQTMGLVVPGSTYLNLAFGRDKGEVEKDEEGMKTAWNFGKNLAWALAKLNAP